MRTSKKLLSAIVSLALIITLITPASVVNAATQTKSASQQYVEAMGSGWNLGNTFDGFDTGGDRGEESWGNPKVTKELLHTIKEAGFDSIRIPLTTTMRIGDSSTNYKLDDTFMDRYEEVVSWALDEGFYVMINVHHDSWDWLSNWDGKTSSEEYLKYVSIWNQLSNRFKDYDNKLMFESINEPQFNSEPETKLATINKTFYDIVRTSGGNNATRMLVLPTLNTNDSQDKCDALYQQIIDLNDKNIIATFHYYSEWVYSANLGKTRFDEDLWGDGNTTAKTSLVASFDRMYNTFTANGIGVICGEYGLLGFDNSDYCNENGEVLKYLEYINYYAKEKGICLMLWDNGQHMNRTSLTWNNESFGNMIEASMKERSSYATDLDYIFVTKENKAKDVSIPLTLNGNTLVSIYNGSKKLVKGTDYTIKDGKAILKGSYISKLIKGSYGVKATLTFKFSAGADWNEYISYVGTPSLGKVKGTTSDTISIPTKFNGDILEKVVSKNSAGTIVSNNTWWNYLQYDSEFTADYNKNTINLLNNYVKLLSDDTYTLTFTFYSGQVLEYKITVKDSKITGSQVSTTTTSKKYTLKLNVNGGKKLSTSSITVTSGDKYGTLPTPTRKGYTFKGWYTKKNGGTKITKSSTVTITKNTTLYAHWSKNSKK